MDNFYNPQWFAIWTYIDGELVMAEWDEDVQAFVFPRPLT